ncbi:Protein Star [Orchesella cincta]|uniref:Protein Star n=1 Tax=Orchesella cincta TaxID=48709 RepID=A0A1D2MSQ8_ORCCI|nr:Protein Star [Orchesella cincta]
MFSKITTKAFLTFLCIILIALFYNTSFIAYHLIFKNFLHDTINASEIKINFSTLEYDDPRLINVIKEKFMTGPPISLDERNLTKAVVTQGFFIEAGANDGEFLSNSLPFEVYHGWTGLLVEGDPVPREKLLSIKRNAWVASSCLSPSKKSDQINMVRHKRWNGIGNIPKFFPERLANDFTEPFEVQCFPLYSLLLAIGKFEIDYLSLDLEGSEYAVLESIPFDKINIKVISVETNPKAYPETFFKIRQLLTKNGYRMRKMIQAPYVCDAVFAKTIM